jgi:hypothetical protein
MRLQYGYDIGASDETNLAQLPRGGNRPRRMARIARKCQIRKPKAI